MSLSSDVISVVGKIVKNVCTNAVKGENGLRLAAVFDLMVSAEYYNSLTNRDWTYCSETPQMLFYPYTSICPRCIGNGKFIFTKGHKPESGKIGMITSELLCQILITFFQHAGKNIRVYKASEPIDVILYDETEKKILLAEIKASPLLTIPLAISCEQLTESTSERERAFTQHTCVDNPNIKLSKFSLFFPQTGDKKESFIPLVIDWSLSNPFYQSILSLMENDPCFFNYYFENWKMAYNVYAKREKDKPIYWLTNGCGQPSPRPKDWPMRKGTGYESISDFKTSVGMDRTDDIKKGIYQVLKLGTEYKPHDPAVKTAILSNIYAVRHYDEYLRTLKDIVWAINPDGQVKQAKDLPLNTPLYNLLDGIISFTRSDIRDEWIRKLFDFEKGI